MIKRHMVKKIVSSILIAVVIFFSVAVPVAKAQGGTWYNQGPREWYLKVYDDSNSSEIFGERYTAAQIDWIIWSIFWWIPTKIAGPDQVSCALGSSSDCFEALISENLNPKQQEAFAYKTDVSTKEDLARLAGTVFEDRPLSAVTYAKEKLRNFNLIPEAKAQSAGFGFAVLEPVLDMWRASRNMAYALFIIAVVALAFMIMFRVKISPQVVITVQSALPKIALALILITFSYAIAGLLVDLMYVVIGLVSILGKEFFPGDVVQSTWVFNFLTKGQPFSGLELQVGALGLFILYLILFVLAANIVLFATFGAITSAIAGAGLSFSLIALTGSGVGLIILLIILGIVLLILLWMAIRVLWTLIKAFANILLLTIFGPLQMALGVIVPALGFGRWIRSFLSNLAVFVVTGVLFLLSFSFLTQAVMLAVRDFVSEGALGIIANFLFGTGSTDVVGNLVTGSGTAAWPPLLGIAQFGTPLVFLGVSFVLFTITPKSADLIKSLIEGQPFSFGTAIGEAGAPATRLWGMTGGPVVDTARKYGAEQITYQILDTLAGSDNVPDSVSGRARAIRDTMVQRNRGRGR